MIGDGSSRVVPTTKRVRWWKASRSCAFASLAALVSTMDAAWSVVPSGKLRRWKPALRLSYVPMSTTDMPNAVFSKRVEGEAASSRCM